MLTTNPAVRVAESAVMKIAWAIARGTISHQPNSDDAPRQRPKIELVIIAKVIHFLRPILSAISFPRIEEITPDILTRAASAVALRKKTLPELAAQKVKKATNQLRDAKSSKLWTV